MNIEEIQNISTHSVQKRKIKERDLEENMLSFLSKLLAKQRGKARRGTNSKENWSAFFFFFGLFILGGSDFSSFLTIPHQESK